MKKLTTYSCALVLGVTSILSSASFASAEPKSLTQEDLKVIQQGK
ncbi:hypothetical protein [Aneurinibacillus terranovensis]|nr:hypothetical protein [Aneurinibacillus terranovensis]